MPGLEKWSWDELHRGGLQGARRVVDLWDAIARKEHHALRSGPDAINWGYNQAFIGTTIRALSKAPASLFAAYVAAMSRVHNQSSFAKVLPQLLSRQYPTLERFTLKPNYANKFKDHSPANAENAFDLELAQAWIRQVALAQRWFRDKKTAGLGVVEAVKLELRTSGHERVWRMWEAVQEGMDDERVKWIDDGMWAASARDKWIGGRSPLEDELVIGADEAKAQPTPLATPEAQPAQAEKEDDMAPSHTIDLASPDPAHLTQAFVATFITGFLRSGHLKETTAIWTWLLTRAPPLVPGVVTWTALLRGYAARGDVNPVQVVFQDMVAAGVEPDLWAWMERVNVLFKARQPDDAMRLAELMFKDARLVKTLEGGKFPVAVYNRLIAGLLSTGRVQGAEDLLAKMEADGVQVTIQLVNELLKHHTRPAVPNLAAVVQCLRMIKDKALEADVYTFTMVLKALLATGQQDATAKLVKIMDSTGVAPSAATYGSIINHLAASSEPEQLAAAVQLVDEMEKKRLVTNEIIYTSVIQGFLRAIGTTPIATRDGAEDEPHPYFTAALTLKSRMERRGIAMNRIGYNALIAAALSLQSPWGTTLALKTFREMQARPGLVRGREEGKDELNKEGKAVTQGDTWYVLLQGLSAMGDWSRARAVVSEMHHSGFVPHSSSLRKLVDRVQRGGYASF